MNWLEDFFKTAATGPASLQGGAATSITPPMNPVQQIAAQRQSVAQETGTPQGNPEVAQAQMQAQQAEQQAQMQSQQAQQDAAAQVQQLQQQMSQEQMKSQQQLAEQANKAHAENEQLKAEIRTEKAKTELASVEAAKSVAMAELHAKGKEIDTNHQVTQSKLDQQQASVQAAPELAGLAQRVSEIGTGATAPTESKKAPVKKANTVYSVPPPAPPPPPQAGAGWGQAMQGYTNPGGKILTPATYRPSFGKIPDAIISSLLPSFYGQPPWAKFFGNGPSEPSGFDPRQLAAGVGQDLARSFL